MSTTALLAVTALATLTACSSNDDGPAFTGGDDNTPTAFPAPSAPVGAMTSATGDVKIDSCEVDPATKIPEAEVTVTNSGKDSATYLVQLEFVDGSGTRLAEGAATANSLGAGQKSKQTAGGTAQVTSKVTCRIAKVQRLAGM